GAGSGAGRRGRAPGRTAAPGAAFTNLRRKWRPRPWGKQNGRMTGSPGVRVTVRCFAAVREALGTEVLGLIVANGTTVEGLRQTLAERAPSLSRLPLAFAVNREYARPETVLGDGDEVALIPPISGGSGARELYRFDLVEQPIDARALEQECRTD